MKSLGEPLVKRPPVELLKVNFHGDRLRLCREPRTNRAVFRYTWGMEIKCEFDMLCEVAQAFVPQFERMIDSLGLKLSHYEDDESCYDTLVSK